MPGTGRCMGMGFWVPRHNARMNIQLLSDLHLESHPDFVPRPAPGADVLVLAGDIGSYQQGSKLAGALDDGDFGLSRFSGWPVPVLFVPGNHEYDLLDFDATHARLRATCERLGIMWLEREVLVLGGVRFVGTTLWSDYDALASLPPPRAKSVPRPVHSGQSHGGAGGSGPHSPSDTADARAAAARESLPRRQPLPAKSRYDPFIVRCSWPSPCANRR